MKAGVKAKKTLLRRKKLVKRRVLARTRLVHFYVREINTYL